MRNRIWALCANALHPHIWSVHNNFSTISPAPRYNFLHTGEVVHNSESTGKHPVSRRFVNILSTSE